MKTTKILLGGLAGGIALFLIGWVTYGVLLADFTATNFNQNAMRPMEEMSWLAMILSNFAFAFFLSFIVGWSNSEGWKFGAKVGFVIGLLYSLTVDLGMYAMADWYLSVGAVIVDIIVYTVVVTVVGIVVALAMGNKKAAAVD